MSPPGVKTNIIIDQQKRDSNINSNILKTKNIIITKVSNYKINHIDETNCKDIHLYVNNKGEILVTDGVASFNIEKIKLENGKELTSKEFNNGFLKAKNHTNRIYFKKRPMERGD